MMRKILVFLALMFSLILVTTSVKADDSKHFYGFNNVTIDTTNLNSDGAYWTLFNNKYYYDYDGYGSIDNGLMLVGDSIDIDSDNSNIQYYALESSSSTMVFDVYNYDNFYLELISYDTEFNAQFYVEYDTAAITISYYFFIPDSSIYMALYDNTLNVTDYESAYKDGFDNATREIFEDGFRSSYGLDVTDSRPYLDGYGAGIQDTILDVYENGFDGPYYEDYEEEDSYSYQNGYDDGMDDLFTNGSAFYDKTVSNAYDYILGRANGISESDGFASEIEDFLPGILGSIFAFFFTIGQISMLGISLLDILVFVLVLGSAIAVLRIIFR